MFGTPPQIPIEAIRTPDLFSLDAARIEQVGLIAPPATVFDRKVQFVYLGTAETPGITVWYRDTGLRSGETQFDFWARNGVTLSEDLLGSQTVEQIISGQAEIGHYATPVTIGSSAGALIHADPVPTRVNKDGVRPYQVFWASGLHNFVVRGGFATAQDAVNFGRAVACSP